MKRNILLGSFGVALLALAWLAAPAFLSPSPLGARDPQRQDDLQRIERKLDQVLTRLERLERLLGERQLILQNPVQPAQPKVVPFPPNRPDPRDTPTVPLGK
jgi:hypothetical protein